MRVGIYLLTSLFSDEHYENFNLWKRTVMKLSKILNGLACFGGHFCYLQIFYLPRKSRTHNGEQPALVQRRNILSLISGSVIGRLRIRHAACSGTSESGAHPRRIGAAGDLRGYRRSQTKELQHLRQNNGKGAPKLGKQQRTTPTLSTEGSKAIPWCSPARTKQETWVRGTWQPVDGVREIGVTFLDGVKTWQPWFDLVFRPHQP